MKIEFCETGAKNRFISIIPEIYQTDIKLAQPIGFKYEHEIRITQRNLGQPKHKILNPHNQTGLWNQQIDLLNIFNSKQNFPNNSRNFNRNHSSPFPSQSINIQPRRVPNRIFRNVR